jgi:pentatricopeptide repeat protein
MKSLYHLKYSIRLDDSEPRYYHAFGRAFLRGGQLGVAKTQFERAVRLDPKNPIYLRQYSWLLLMIGKKTEARLYAKKAVELAPEDLKARWCLVRAYMESRMYAHALNLLKQMRQNPGVEVDSRFRYAIDECQFRLNQSPEGAVIRMIRQGMRIDGHPFHMKHFRWAEQAWLDYCAVERPHRSRALLPAYAAAISWLSLDDQEADQPGCFETVLERFKTSSQEVWPVIKKFQDFWAAASYKRRV